MSRRHFKFGQIIAINTTTAGIAPSRTAGRPLSSLLSSQLPATRTCS